MTCNTPTPVLPLLLPFALLSFLQLLFFPSQITPRKLLPAYSLHARASDRAGDGSEGCIGRSGQQAYHPDKRRTHWVRRRRSSCQARVWSHSPTTTMGSLWIPGRTRQSRGCRLTHRDCWMCVPPALVPFPLLYRLREWEQKVSERQKGNSQWSCRGNRSSGRGARHDSCQTHIPRERGGSLCVTGLQISAKRG